MQEILIAITSLLAGYFFKSLENKKRYQREVKLEVLRNRLKAYEIAQQYLTELKLTYPTNFGICPAVLYSFEESKRITELHREFLKVSQFTSLKCRYYFHQLHTTIMAIALNIPNSQVSFQTIGSRIKVDYEKYLGVIGHVIEYDIDNLHSTSRLKQADATMREKPNIDYDFYYKLVATAQKVFPDIAFPDPIRGTTKSKTNSPKVNH